MAAETLVDRDRWDGEALVRQLDRDQFPVSAAFWYYDSEYEKWDLIIESPIVRSEGRLEAYRKLIKSIKRIKKQPRSKFALESSRVTLVKEDDHLPSLLRQAISTGRDIAGIRFTRNTIAGVFIEDAYIYRMLQPERVARS